MFVIRHAADRGHANHGWLDSHHSFSFADYRDEDHVHFGPLRVINEDRVAPGAGFGTHSHRDMEIISYVLEGELAHTDSMGNKVVIRPGEVQIMSAGTGVTHSEENHASTVTHFLQIWIIPNRLHLKPGYQQTFFPDAEKRGKLRLVASERGEHGSVTVNQDVRLYAGLFGADESAHHTIDFERIVYVHVVRGTVHVNGHPLNAGDAAKITGENRVELSDGVDGEVLLFDMAPLD
ncbi:pirin family protein [Luteibacter sp. 3190]|uniref:pirin family protein n=1 Tax=Luteibacter sp. 3190 TaxID=2817736 RepID=UPI00285C9EE0|nr:pirin family protein [Luteibacter sp. 3190]MDR6935658.1 redox-sensitive bicupin YhaK (pirin superfamily) [Luteibacter sp. 3190]